MTDQNRNSLLGIVAGLAIGALVTLAGSDGSSQVGSIAVFAVCGMLAFVINWVVFVPSNIAKTEHYFDLTGSADMTQAIESQIERFAPGFRDLILDRHAMGPAALEEWNPNLVGGDIAGGRTDGLRMLLRPTLKLDPYSAGPGLFLCSSATPPGPGVHGMSGYHAAQAALRADQ